MSSVACAGTARACRPDGFKSKPASLAIVAVPVGAAHGTDLSLFAAPTQWKFVSSEGDGLFAEHPEGVGKKDKAVPCLRPPPPPAPRLRPSPGGAIVPFLALESEEESDEEEEEAPRCPKAPRLGPQADPPHAAAMPELVLPPSMSSFDTAALDASFGFLLSDLDGAESDEADAENGSGGADIWNRMVSANASTACAEDLEERGQSPGLSDLFSSCTNGKLRCTADGP